MSRAGTNKKTWVWAAVLLAAPLLASAQLAQPEPWTADDIKDVLTLIANFLIAVGIVGAVITIVTAGIVYFASGFNANAVAKAKGLFRSALIGTLLIVGAGVIINTIGVIVTGEFFGVVGPPGAGGGAQIGDACENDDDCAGGDESLICSQTLDKKVSICRRENGNKIGEPCIDKDDCVSGLACDTGVISTSGQGKKVSRVGTCKQPRPAPTLKP